MESAAQSRVDSGMAQNAVSVTTTAPNGARRRRNGVESRRVLIESTLSLLSQGKAPTSVNITSLAGLAQPTFYAHFKSVDACVLAAAQYVQAKILEHRDYERTKQPENAIFSPEALEQIMSRWLHASLTTSPMLDALDRFQHDKTPVGDLVRQMNVDIRTETAERLFATAATSGVTREHFKEFCLLAELTIASSRAISRLLIDGKVDLHLAARTLARNIGAQLFVTAAACEGDPSNLIDNTGWTATGPRR